MKFLFILDGFVLDQYVMSQNTYCRWVNPFWRFLVAIEVVLLCQCLFFSTISFFCYIINSHIMSRRYMYKDIHKVGVRQAKCLLNHQWQTLTRGSILSAKYAKKTTEISAQQINLHFFFVNTTGKFCVEKINLFLLWLRSPFTTVTNQWKKQCEIGS